MAKPIIFQLEISGYQRARIDDDGAVVRPLNAEEIAQIFSEELNRHARILSDNGKLKVTFKRVA